MARVHTHPKIDQISYKLVVLDCDLQFLVLDLLSVVMELLSCSKLAGFHSRSI